MKKLLLIALIILLTILLVFTAVKGWGAGPINVLSISQMRDKNAKLDKEIQDAKLLADRDYEQQLSEQDVNIKDLEDMKKQYEDLVAVNIDENAEPSSQLERYEMEYLWTQIGNHAKEEGVTLRIDVSRSFEPTVQRQQQEENVEDEKTKNTTEDTRNTIGNSTARENGIEDPNQSTLEAAVVSSTSTGADSAEDVKYDLTFGAIGSYVSVADFIYAIENDSSLGFKIEEFKMTEESNIDSTGFVSGTFTCKGIRIKKITETTKEQQNESNGKTSNTTNNTTKNTTNSSRTSNSTNKSSTSNSSR